MFPLWDVAIAPILSAAGAQKIVEIGALRGENTVQILDHLGPNAELHVIDPVPDFDPGEHEAMFPGRYHFHEALSLDVLPDLEPMDAALIDGDHNWWTVMNECRLLAESSMRAGVAMPVMILHDVLWPYGRRDLYYDPSNVPEERRQPFARRGIKLGESTLVHNGGLNPHMANAIEEGGPANGVMTGLDDFVAGHPKPLRTVVLPFYFGLAIVAEEERLAAEPELAAAFDHLESAEARYEMLEVAENIHLKAMLLQHHFLTGRNKLLDRYLATIKSSLLNEHYLDLETRLDYLEACIRDRVGPRVPELRDPSRFDRQRHNRIARPRLGDTEPTPHQARSFVPYAAMGRNRLDQLHASLDEVHGKRVQGDFVEVGTGRGGGAILMRAFLEAWEVRRRKVWVADRFRSAPDGETQPKMPPGGARDFHADLNMVRDAFDRFDLLDDQVRFVQGDGGVALAKSGINAIALLRIGAGEDITQTLGALYDRVSPDGRIIIDLGDSETAADDVAAFRTERGVHAPLESVDEHTVTWTKHAEDRTADAPKLEGRVGVRLARPRVTGPIDLSVVVVFYNMRREAARTLRSLSRSYQEGIDNRSYEVLVIDNGSAPEQRLDAEFVEAFGPEFRLIDMGDAARPSPVSALNRGIAEGRGDVFALMIDGAHVLTPGVLRHGLGAIDTYGPAIVATQQWYTGPGQQSDTMYDGYDQAYEDRLFDQIDWPHNGYRLFEIGHFVGDRDWFDGVWESNCMFATRAQLAQVGGFEERFDEPGGSFANLELYERLGSDPSIAVCSIIGEGSFHQLHGGTTTNQPDPAERRARVYGYSQQYAELRGRPFKGPGRPLHYVGRLPNDAARRSKPRRLSAAMFNEAAGTTDGPSEHPTPMPEELRESFTEAVWRSHAWRDTTWLGEAVDLPPTDLLAFQEIVYDVRPDWIIVTGANRGRLAFLASMCDLAGHGQVLAVGSGDSPDHPRLVAIEGEPTDPTVVDEVHERVGSGSAMVVLGGCRPRAETFREFSRYVDLVPVESYVVVTDTIVNGRPVWPAFGPGPGEGVKQILTSHGEFVSDSRMEKFELSFNRGGYLRRTG